MLHGGQIVAAVTVAHADGIELLSGSVLGATRLLLMAACSSTPPAPPRSPPVRPPNQLPIGSRPRWSAKIGSSKRRCRRFSTPVRAWGCSGRACAGKPSAPPRPAAAARFFQQNFDEYALDDGHGLLTGYMEAQLRGSWRPTARLNYPVYGTPSDLRGVPTTRRARSRRHLPLPCGRQC